MAEIDWEAAARNAAVLRRERINDAYAGCWQSAATQRLFAWIVWEASAEVFDAFLELPNRIIHGEAYQDMVGRDGAK